jgi:N-terminal domain of reverse transcriptase
MAANASAGQLTDMDAGAASDDARAWHQIDWGKVEREVRRLQARIVKARTVVRPRAAHPARS